MLLGGPSIEEISESKAESTRNASERIMKQGDGICTSDLAMSNVIIK